MVECVRAQSDTSADRAAREEGGWRVYGVFRRTETPVPQLKISRGKEDDREQKIKAQQPSVTSRLDSRAQKLTLRSPHLTLAVTQAKKSRLVNTFRFIVITSQHNCSFLAGTAKLHTLVWTPTLTCYTGL